MFHGQIRREKTKHGWKVFRIFCNFVVIVVAPSNVLIIRLLFYYKIERAFVTKLFIL